MIMIRCKNWLCARYNNNDYTGFFSSGIGTSDNVTTTATITTTTITAITSTQLTATMTAQQTNVNHINASNIIMRQQQQQQHQNYQHQTQHQQHNHSQYQYQQQRHHQQSVANGNIITGYVQQQRPQHYYGTTTTNKANFVNVASTIITTTTGTATAITTNMVTVTSTANITTTSTSTSTSTASNVHAVTFLNNAPSSSNGGMVNTTTRLMNNNDMQHVTCQQQQQQQQHQNKQRHLSDDTADGYETTDDIMGNHVVNSSILIDDTLPTSKNCYRLVILGSSRVGKSSIIARFLGNRFEEAYTPTIEDFHRKLYRIRNEVYQLDILDTSGYHPFPAMRRLSFLTGDLFILVFSMDSRESFEEVVRLRENILETKWAALNPGSGLKKKSLPKIPMILAGNKCDCDIRTVQLDEIMGYIAGQDSCCVFVECSAKQNHRIDDLFYALFTVSNLPLEMAPNHHRRVITQFGAPSPLPPHSSMGSAKKNTLSIKRRFSDACGVVTPNARRPSIRTDLNLMRSKTMGLAENDVSSARKKCCIM